MHFDHEENNFLQDLVFMIKMKIHPLLPLLESWTRASVPHSLGLVLYSSQPNMFSQESEKRLEFNETNQFIDILTTGIVWETSRMLQGVLGLAILITKVSKMIFYSVYSWICLRYTLVISINQLIQNSVNSFYIFMHFTTDGVPFCHYTPITATVLLHYSMSKMEI